MESWDFERTAPRKITTAGSQLLIRQQTMAKYDIQTLVDGISNLAL